ELLVIPNDTQPYFTRRIDAANPTSFNLRLIAGLNETGAIPNEGKSLIVFATVHDTLHIRVFDGEGKLVIDTDEERLAKKSGRMEGNLGEIRMLKKALYGLWPPHDLTTSEKHRVIRELTWLTGYNFPEPANKTAQLEIDLHRGIWIKGKVTEKDTKLP